VIVVGTRRSVKQVAGRAHRIRPTQPPAPLLRDASIRYGSRHAARTDRQPPRPVGGHPDPRRLCHLPPRLRSAHGPRPGAVLAQRWRELHENNVARLDQYRPALHAVLADLHDVLDARLEDRALWPSIKAAYSALIAERDDWELAETFFNSVTRRIFSTVGLDQSVEFVDTDFDTPPTPAAGRCSRPRSAPTAGGRSSHGSWRPGTSAPASPIPNAMAPRSAAASRPISRSTAPKAPSRASS